MAHETFLQSIFKHGLRSKYIKKFLNSSPISNLLKGATGSGLTDAQKEANVFTAQQAQNQMDFQQQMRDTQYQSAVADMQKAGVNPALMYGSGASGNSAPSGAMASSVATGPTDLVGLLGQMANLSLLDSQRRNIDASTDKMMQEREEVVARTDNFRRQSEKILKEMDVMDSNIRKINLEGDSLEIVNRYLDAEKNMALSIQQMNLEQIQSQIRLNEKEWEKLDSEVKLSIQRLANAEQELKNLLAQEHLTKAQVGQVAELTKNIKTERTKLENENKISEKQLNWFVHDKIVGDVKTAGQVVGSFFGLGKFASVAKGLLRNNRSAPVDLSGYGAYGSYD